MLGDLERKWIGWAKRNSARLTNSTDGGDGGLLGWKPTEETRVKWRARKNAWKGRKHTEDSKRRMSESQKRRWIPELRAAQSRRHKGKTISIEQRQIVSEDSRRRWADPVFRARNIEIRRASERSGRAWIGHQKQARAISRPVVDQYGTIYSSVNGAAAAIGVRASNVSAVVNGRRKHVRGFTFSRYETGKQGGDTRHVN